MVIIDVFEGSFSSSDLPWSTMEPSALKTTSTVSVMCQDALVLSAEDGIGLLDPDSLWLPDDDEIRLSNPDALVLLDQDLTPGSPGRLRGLQRQKNVQ